MCPSLGSSSSIHLFPSSNSHLSRMKTPSLQHTQLHFFQGINPLFVLHYRFLLVIPHPPSRIRSIHPLLSTCPGSFTSPFSHPPPPFCLFVLWQLPFSKRPITPAIPLFSPHLHFPNTTVSPFSKTTASRPPLNQFSLAADARSIVPTSKTVSRRASPRPRRAQANQPKSHQLALAL